MSDYAKEINQWIKERDEAILSFDVQKFREFYDKWMRRGMYQIPLPQNDVFVKLSMMQSVLVLKSANAKQKSEAKDWLLKHDFNMDPWEN